MPRLTLRRLEAFYGYLFLLPWLIGFVLFVGGPMLASLGLSFTRYAIAKPPVFIGAVVAFTWRRHERRVVPASPA